MEKENAIAELLVARASFNYFFFDLRLSPINRIRERG
jgi:hypothetical protein